MLSHYWVTKVIYFSKQQIKISVFLNFIDFLKAMVVNHDLAPVQPGRECVWMIASPASAGQALRDYKQFVSTLLLMPCGEDLLHFG